MRTPTILPGQTKLFDFDQRGAAITHDDCDRCYGTRTVVRRGREISCVFCKSGGSK